MTAVGLPAPRAVPAAPAPRGRAMIPGIGEPLPAGETVLWTGGPERAAIARRVCHTRGVAAYFGVLLAFLLLGGRSPGGAMRDAASGAALLVGMGAAVLAFAHVYAALVARSTVYAITERRLVLRIGVAIPAVLNIPFDRVESVDLRTAADGTGDVTVTLTGNARVAYLLLWPHARPWRYAQPQPALRGLRDAVDVGATLAEAVRASVAAADAPTTAPRPAAQEVA
jgi:hypothetical protein